MKKFKFAPAITLFALSSLFSFHALADDSLLSWSGQILNHYQNDDWTGETCVSDLQSLETKINQLSAPGLKKEDLKSEAPALLDNLFKTRVAIHSRLSPSLSDDCVKEARNLSRQFRFLEDFLGEILYQTTPIDVDNYDFEKLGPTPIDENTNGFLLQKAAENFDFKKGDLMIARGVSLLSAMIARLGDTESQFSHVVFVTQNPDKADDAKDKMQTIESYVGLGVQIYEREYALRNYNARLLVLRPKDQSLGEKASDFMRQYVVDHQGKNVIH